MTNKSILYVCMLIMMFLTFFLYLFRQTHCAGLDARVSSLERQLADLQVTSEDEGAGDLGAYGGAPLLLILLHYPMLRRVQLMVRMIGGATLMRMRRMTRRPRLMRSRLGFR